MSNIKPLAAKREDSAAGRPAYAKPQLKVFGPVGALTQGGTGSKIEGAMGMGMGMMMGSGNTMRSPLP